MAESIIQRKVFSRIIHYTGTTDTSGNLVIPKSVIDPMTTLAILGFTDKGYPSALQVGGTQYAVHVSNYQGQPLASTSLTVYLAV